MEGTTQPHDAKQSLHSVKGAGAKEEILWAKRSGLGWILSSQVVKVDGCMGSGPSSDTCQLGEHEQGISILLASVSPSVKWR